MIRSIQIVLVAFLALGIMVPGQALAENVEAGHLMFETEEGELNVHLSEHGIRYDIPDAEEETSMLFIIEEDEPLLYFLSHREQRAMRVSEQEIQEFQQVLRRQMQQMERMMEDMPEEVRDQYRQQMDLPDPRDLDREELPTTEFVEEETVEWNGLPAHRGTLQTNGTEVGTGTRLVDPVIELTPAQREMQERFEALLNRLAGMTANMAMMEDPDTSVSFKEIARMAEYETEDASGILREWGPRTVDSSLFRVPDDYSVQSLGHQMEQMEQMEGMGPPGQ